MSARAIGEGTRNTPTSNPTLTQLAHHKTPSTHPSINHHLSWPKKPPDTQPQHPLGAAVFNFANKTTHTDTRHTRIVTAPVGGQHSTDSDKLTHTLVTSTDATRPGPVAHMHTSSSIDDDKGKKTMCIPSESDQHHEPHSGKSSNKDKNITDNEHRTMCECPSTDHSHPLVQDGPAFNRVKKVQFDPTVKHHPQEQETQLKPGLPSHAVAKTAAHTQCQPNTTHTEATTLPYPFLGHHMTRLGPSGLPLPWSGWCAAPENAHNAHRQGD